MSTNGLTVTRPDGSSPPRQSMIADSSAPGRRGPTTAPTSTAVTPIASPTFSNAAPPAALAEVTQPLLRSRRATRWTNTNTRAAAT